MAGSLDPVLSSHQLFKAKKNVIKGQKIIFNYIDGIYLFFGTRYLRKYFKFYFQFLKHQELIYISVNLNNTNYYASKFYFN